MSRVNGFFGHVQKNHARSLTMFMGFMVALHITVAAILSIPFPFWPDFPAVFDNPLGYIREAGLIVTIFNTALFALFYFANTFIIRLSTGYKPLPYEANPRLHRITEELAMLAGIPTPQLEYMPVPALNSFASGLTQKTAHIIVTQGLLEALDDEELSAVIAHEIAHIKHGDMHMMTVASAATDSVKFINTLNPMRFSWLKNFPIFIIILLAPLIIPLGILAVFYSFIMQVALLVANTTRYVISSSREFIADAEAVRLTHNPAALASALSKIHGRSNLYHMDTMAEAMMIDGPASGKNASHPPMEDRIQVLAELSGSMIHGAGQRKDTRARSLQANHGSAYGGSSSFGQVPSSFSQGFAPVARMHAGNVRNYIPDSPDYAPHQGATFKKRESASILDRMIEDNDGEYGLDQSARYVVIALLVIFLGHGYLQKTKPKDPPRKSAYIKPVLKLTPAFATLDLDGRGLHTNRVSGNSSSVYFNSLNDGVRRKTGWIDAREGFLFFDKNKNKQMDGLKELVSIPYEKAANSSYLAALRPLDSNKNGVINKHDRSFKNIMIWRDLNQNGTFEDKEAFSLDDYGITRIETKGEIMTGPNGRTVASGAKLYSRSQFTYDRSLVKNRGRTVTVTSIKDGQIKVKTQLSPQSKTSSVFMTSFETDLTRYMMADGELVVKALENGAETSKHKPALVKSDPSKSTVKVTPKAAPEKRQFVTKKIPAPALRRP